jgi:hypothetical protein
MVELQMAEDDQITITQMLRAIAQLTDAELLQLKATARKEAEKRNLKPSRHAIHSRGAAFHIIAKR